jgi:hypothetical protein
MNDEQKVYDTIKRLGCVNDLSVVGAFPRIDVYGVIRALVQRGLSERTGTGAVRIVESPVVPAAPAPVEIAEPLISKLTRKRRYCSRLNPRKNLKRQMASRIIHYLAHISTGNYYSSPWISRIRQGRERPE